MSKTATCAKKMLMISLPSFLTHYTESIPHPKISTIPNKSMKYWKKPFHLHISNFKITTFTIMTSNSSKESIKKSNSPRKSKC